MDIIQLYQDYSIDFRTKEHKHCRPGWVNTPCPFCISHPGHEGYHLGYQISSNHYVCWRCGWHPVLQTIEKLLRIPENQARKVLKHYGILVPTLSKFPDVEIEKKPFKMPSGLTKLSHRHKEYLHGRGFDPDYLEFTWGLRSAGPISILEINENKSLDYKHRIIIPYYWNGQIGSFDARDVTGKAENKYQACPIELELYPHKEILYCKQEALMDTAIAVEGPSDVWRFGVDSFATSGIKFTAKQLRLIAQMFKRVPVCFDGGKDEIQAAEQAKKLVAGLRFRGVDSFPVKIEGDPGGMKQDDANHLVNQLIKHYL